MRWRKSARRDCSASRGCTIEGEGEGARVPADPYPDMDGDGDDVATDGGAGSLDAVEELRRLGRVAGPGHPAARVLEGTAARLHAVLTRDGGVDGHEVLEVMVSSLDVSALHCAHSYTPFAFSSCKQPYTLNYNRVPAFLTARHEQRRRPQPLGPAPSLTRLRFRIRALQDMRRVAESSASAAATPPGGAEAALREHALALDASERDRDKYKSMLTDAEQRMETLLAMNAQLKAELQVAPGINRSQRPCAHSATFVS